MTSRGRGRTPSYRGGRGGRGFPPIQYGNRSLINSDISGISLLRQLENNPETLKKVQDLLKANQSGEGSSSQNNTYANILAEQEDEESYERKPYHQNTILILENKDLQWKEEPWHLIQRYLGTASYAVGSYKQRYIYEAMLLVTDSIDRRHFYPSGKDESPANQVIPDNQAKIYNFSKMIIKQIISVEEWGLNPLSEKEFRIPSQNIIVKFNFWDYKEAFYKSFLYQNPDRKHSWFIKICPQVYKRKIPNWLYDWWIIYGAEENILPPIFLELFHEWRKVSPAIIEAEFDKTYCHNMAVLHFFCEFGIPWIWKWEPEVSYTHSNIPCLNRVGYIKFWKKMIRLNKEGIIEGQDTISQIKEKIVEYKKRISENQQREAFNPFTIIEERIRSPNLSKEEQFNKFMKEAKMAIFGYDDEMAEGSGSKISSTEDMFQDSQDPFDVDDHNMAEYFDTLRQEEKRNKKSPSDSGSNKEEEQRNNSNNKEGQTNKEEDKKKGEEDKKKKGRRR